MESQYANHLDSVEDFNDEGVDGILVCSVHLLCIAVGDDHAACHSPMSEERG